MNISPSDDRQEILHGGTPPGVSSSAPSSASLVGSPSVTSHVFSPERGHTLEPPRQACRRSPRKHPRSEQQDEMAGYDSDEDGPCFDAIAVEGVQDFDEDELMAETSDQAASKSCQQADNWGAFISSWAVH